uniref:Ubiquinone biosynthesis O-methyltransferase, mitochondrial n=1 Tax=Acrobeloides nanus TaxID=290746 RepID=A0A914E9U7_9BILA
MGTIFVKDLTPYQKVDGNQSTLDTNDISRFERLATEWLDENGSFKPLHAFNQVRVPWINTALEKRRNEKTSVKPLDGLRLLDIGCGGGILSIPLARLGAQVDGIDASIEAVRIAEFAASRTLTPNLRNNITFHCVTIEDFVKTHLETYDAVIASEIIEHVSNVEMFLDCCVKACKKDGSLFFTTINKTALSNIFAIWLAEDILRIVPRGIHDWNKFVAPEDLRKMLNDRDCRIRSVQGLAYNPLTNHWSWCTSRDVNYALYARKC